MSLDSLPSRTVSIARSWCAELRRNAWWLVPLAIVDLTVGAWYVSGRAAIEGSEPEPPPIHQSPREPEPGMDRGATGRSYKSREPETCMNWDPAWRQYDEGHQLLTFPLRECTAFDPWGGKLESAGCTAPRGPRVHLKATGEIVFYASDAFADYRLRFTSFLMMGGHVDGSEIHANAVTVVDSQGRPQYRSEHWGDVWSINVYTGDLNQDGKPDFVLDLLTWTACHLNGEVMFVLSSEYEHEYVRMDTTAFFGRDFFQFDEAGPTYFVQKSGGRWTDFVFSVYRIEGTNLRPVDERITGFPKALPNPADLAGFWGEISRLADRFKTDHATAVDHLKQQP